MDHYAKKIEGGYIPTDSMVVNVDKEAVKASGMLLPFGPDSIPDKMVISLKNALQQQGGVYRNDLMIYEMLAHADWKRPMYMSVTLGTDNYADLDNYLILEGLAYRITPFNYGKRGVIDSDLMYKNMMERFKYGNVKQEGIYLDETVSRMCSTHRRMFQTLANSLLSRGKVAEAKKVLQKCEAELPASTIPYTDDDADLAILWMEVGDKKEATRVAKSILKYCDQYLTYLNSLDWEHIQTYTRTAYFLTASYIRCEHVLRECKDSQASFYTQRMNELSRTEAFSLGLKVYQQQQM